MVYARITGPILNFTYNSLSSMIQKKTASFFFSAIMTTDYIMAADCCQRKTKMTIHTYINETKQYFKH